MRKTQMPKNSANYL